jgi:hypothetical protein
VSALARRILKLGLTIALVAGPAQTAHSTSWPPLDRLLSEDEELQSALSNGVWIGRLHIVDTQHALRRSAELEPYVEAEPIQWLAGGCAERHIVLYAPPTEPGGLDDLTQWSPSQRSSAFVMVYARRSSGRLYVDRSPFAFHGGCFPLSKEQWPAIEVRVRRAVESLELEALARGASSIVIGSCRGVVSSIDRGRPRRGYSIAVERSVVGDADPGSLVVLDPVGWRPDSTRRLIFLAESEGGRLETIGFTLGRSPIVGSRLPAFAGITLEQAVARIRHARAIADPH